jgi:hypothetical protein
MKSRRYLTAGITAALVAAGCASSGNEVLKARDAAADSRPAAPVQRHP